MGHTDRQSMRHTDRVWDTQTEYETHRQSMGHTDRHSMGHTDRQSMRHTDRVWDTQTEIVQVNATFSDYT